MKKSILIILVVLFMGCSLEPETFTKTFKNESSYLIAITPNGQDWDGFYLDSMQSRSIELDTSKCYFMYTHAGYVTATVNTDKDIVTFRNR